jgi:hypothetical protein
MPGLAAKLVLAVSLAMILLPAVAAATLGASPSPSRPVSSDTRSPLEGPGFVGDPAAAILLVVAIGTAAVVATLLYVRLTGGSRGPRA